MEALKTQSKCLRQGKWKTVSRVILVSTTRRSRLAWYLTTFLELGGFERWLGTEGSVKVYIRQEISCLRQRDIVALASFARFSHYWRIDL